MTERSDSEAKARDLKQRSLEQHARYRGKIQIMPKCRVGEGDFSIWYTPGVAEPCREIAAAPSQVYDYTNKANTIAIVTDGSRVLGLGNIGPEAGLPVMEGKALLFKVLGGVDAVPLCLATQEPDDIVAAVRWLEPSFGGINLEDIEQPKCFSVLGAARDSLRIPVWHDDQQGTATAALAGLLNALKVVGKNLAEVRIVLVGVGAANVSVYRLLRSIGVDAAAVTAVDSRGLLHRGRGDIEAEQHRFADKWRICTETNPAGLSGDVGQAFLGADVCIAFSRPGPDVIDAAWVKTMARDPVVFACANPVPEIWPAEAMAAGARIVATGRGDFPNQLNNSLVFPGMFRGVLDVRARTISDEMAHAAALALADFAEGQGLAADRILPPMDDWKVAATVAAAAGQKAIEQGLAENPMPGPALYDQAKDTIAEARAAVTRLFGR